MDISPEESKRIEGETNESIIQINQSASNLNQLLHELELENQIKEGKKEECEGEKVDEAKVDENVGESNKDGSEDQISQREMDEEGSPRSLRIAEDDEVCENEDVDGNEVTKNETIGQSAVLDGNGNEDTTDREKSDGRTNGVDSHEEEGNAIKLEIELKRDEEKCEAELTSDGRIINGSQEEII